MRFLFVSDFIPDRASGAAGTLMELAEALQALGHPVDQRWRDDDTSGGTLDRHLALGRRQRLQVESALSIAHYDVVVVSQPFAFRVFERTRARHPLTLFLNRTHGWEARVYEQQYRFGWDRGRSPAGRMASRIGELLARRACRRTARAAHGIITASSSDADFIRNAYGLTEAEVPVITYGTDLPPVSRPAVSGPVGVLYVGSWIPRKGSQVLERILPPMARDTDLRFTVVTGRESHARLRTTMSDFGDRLTLHAGLDRRAIAPVYASHDVLLAPSLCEGFGKAALEGMRSGMCVVGFPEGGLVDLAADGVHALLAPLGDADALGARLREAVVSPNLIRRIGTQAQARASDLTWERTARETVAFAGERRRSMRMP